MMIVWRVMTKKILFVILAALLLPALLAACDKTPKPPLVFGAAAWPGYEPVYLAQSLGYLPAQGVRLTEYADAAQVSQALRNHTVQVAGVTLGEALVLRRDIPDLRIVLLLDASNGADALIAQPGITALAQLQGKRVGVDGSALGAYFLNLALKSAGLRSQQVRIVPLAADKQEAAFRAHQVDAVVCAGPVGSRLLQAGGQQLFDSSRVPGKILNVLVMRDADIGEYYQEMLQLLQGWRRAMDYIQAEPAKALPAMAKREQADPEQFSRMLHGIELFGLQRNRELLLSEPPAVAPSIDEMQRFMLNNDLLRVGVDGSVLVATALLADIKPDRPD